jgi:hypothetical protein
VLAMRRLKREYHSIMQPKADVDRSRFPHFDQRRQLPASGQRSAGPQATFHAPTDHEGKNANRAVHLIPTRRHAGCLVASLPASVAPAVRDR